MKKLAVFLLSFAIASSAFAGSISRGGASFSRSAVSASPARSIGMSRPSAVPSISPGPGYSYSASSSPTSSASVNHYAPPPAAAPSTGSTFLSSMGGSLAGSAIGSALFSNHGGGTTVVNAGGGSVPVAAGVPAGGQVVVSQASPSPAGFMWQLLGVVVAGVLIAGLLWIVYSAVKTARSAASQRRMADDPAALPFSPVGRFLAIQKAFAAKDAQALRTLLGPAMAEQMLADLPDEPTEPRLTGIRYTLADASDSVISINYQAHDAMDGSDLSETWHFTRSGADWVLNGIDQE